MREPFLLSHGCLLCLRVMSLSCFYNPHHGSLIHATGHAEVWTDWNSTSKFSQYGWRCTTNEDAYSNKTLMGNWNQERYDIRKIAQPKPLPSQYAHYFESIYSSDYNKERHHGSRRFKQEPHWFPGHQPELEPPPFKPTARSCYMIDYGPSQGRTPVICEMLGEKQEGAQQKQ
uniref:Chromosome 11 open reading frame 1 n=1 Tax=Chelydra serpentina TaxID=8475 RepID=A0A8C3TJC7_CHESE